MEGNDTIMIISDGMLPAEVRRCLGEEEGYGFTVRDFKVEDFYRKTISELKIFKDEVKNRVVFFDYSDEDTRHWLELNYFDIKGLRDDKVTKLSVVVIYKKHKRDRWICELAPDMVIRMTKLVELPILDAFREDLHRDLSRLTKKLHRPTNKFLLFLKAVGGLVGRS